MANENKFDFSKDFAQFIELYTKELDKNMPMSGDDVTDKDRYDLFAKVVTAYNLGLIHSDLNTFLNLILQAQAQQAAQTEAFQKQMKKSQASMESQNKEFEAQYKAAGLDKEAEKLRDEMKKYAESFRDLTQKLQKDAEKAAKRDNPNDLKVVSEDGETIGSVSDEPVEDTKEDSAANN